MSVQTETDWFAHACEMLTPLAPGPKLSAISPRSTAVCTECGETVRARPEVSSPTSVRYVLPVDAEGRCPVCAWCDDGR